MKTVGNGLDRSADLQPTSDFLGTVKTVPYINLKQLTIYNYQLTIKVVGFQPAL